MLDKNKFFCPQRHKLREEDERKRVEFQRTLVRIAAVCAICILGWFVLGGNLGVLSMMRARVYDSALQKMIAAEETKSRALDAEITAYATNLTTIESAARTKLGMTAKNEFVFVFKKDTSRTEMGK